MAGDAPYLYDGFSRMSYTVVYTTLNLSCLLRDRMASARTKAEQAQEAAGQAAADAEVALATARQYSPIHSQPGALACFCTVLLQ